MNSAAWNSLLIGHLPFPGPLLPPLATHLHRHYTLFSLSFFGSKEWTETISNGLEHSLLRSKNDQIVNTHNESLCLLSYCTWQKLTAEMLLHHDPQDLRPFFLKHNYFINSLPCTTFSVISAFSFFFSFLLKIRYEIAWYARAIIVELVWL